MIVLFILGVTGSKLKILEAIMVKRQLRKIIVLLTRKFLNYVRKEINPLSRFELCKNNITCTKLFPKKKKCISFNLD